MKKLWMLYSFLLLLALGLLSGCTGTYSASYGVPYYNNTSWNHRHDYHHYRPKPNVRPPSQRPNRPSKPPANRPRPKGRTR